MPDAKPRSSGGSPYPLYLDERMLSALATAATAAGDFAAVVDALAPTSLATPGDLSAVSVGDVVDVRGTCLGNPLFTALDFVATMLPLVIGPEPPIDTRPRRPATAVGAAARAAADDEAGTQRVLVGTVLAARDGLRESAVVDVLVRTPDGLNAVVVLDRSTLTPAGEEQLRDGTFRVIGKVTAVLGNNDHVNLFRRTPIGATGVQASRDMLAELIDAGVDVEVSDPVVQGPAVQILPLAVLV
jgi:hypothetical protein